MTLLIQFAVVRAYQLHRLVSSPGLLTDADLDDLREIAAKYPCFQTIRALIARHTQSAADIQRAATITADRSALKRFVEADLPKEQMAASEEESAQAQSAQAESAKHTKAAPAQDESAQVAINADEGELFTFTDDSDLFEKLKKSDEELADEERLRASEAQQHPGSDATKPDDEKLAPALEVPKATDEQEEAAKPQEQPQPFSASDDADPPVQPTADKDVSPYEDAAPDKDRLGKPGEKTAMGYVSFEEEAGLTPRPQKQSESPTPKANEEADEPWPADEQQIRENLRKAHQEIMRKQAEFMAYEPKKPTPPEAASESPAPAAPAQPPAPEQPKTQQSGFDDPDEFFSRFEDRDTAGSTVAPPPIIAPDPALEHEPIFAPDAALGFDIPLAMMQESTNQHQDDPNELEDLASVVDRFLAQEHKPPKIGGQAEKQHDLSAPSVSANPNWATESLARIYAKQGNYTKAKAVYQQLQLKYPEKSTYFAGLIKNLDDSRES